MTKLRLFALAGLLAVLGVGLMVWEPAEPEAECAAAGGPTSGFMDTEKNCPISIESWERIRAAQGGTRWDNIGGLVLVVGSLGTAGVAAFRKPKTAA